MNATPIHRVLLNSAVPRQSKNKPNPHQHPSLQRGQLNATAKSEFEVSKDDVISISEEGSFIAVCFSDGTSLRTPLTNVLCVYPPVPYLLVAELNVSGDKKKKAPKKTA